MSATSATTEHDLAALALDQQLCFPLYVASRLVVQVYRPHLEALGLTYPQYLVLLVLWEKDGSTVGEIGDRLELDSGTLTPVLKRLAADGRITRRRGPGDDRKVENWLTASGQALKIRAAPIPDRLLCATALEPCEVDALLDALRPVLQKLVAHQGC
jgi:DNA-binding MarR family transcriptional regulator